MLAAPDETNALQNWVAAGTNDLAKSGTLTFTANRGYASNGTTGYLNASRLVNTYDDTNMTAGFYGITPQASPNAPNSLITIDPNTGVAQLVGDLRIPGSDIAFNRAGILFAWLPGTSQLGIVNTSNGGSQCTAGFGVKDEK